jgi:bisphosphoglycerate-independent phosphoglycerate mutase (AlkP superfamily)
LLFRVSLFIGEKESFLYREKETFEIVKMDGRRKENFHFSMEGLAEIFENFRADRIRILPRALRIHSFLIA